MKKTITIVGPTASGKTSLAIKLAKKINGEIIGLDSRQIYKGMSIGTSQPTKTEMLGISHHLIGFRELSEPISAGEFAEMVINTRSKIINKGKVPIICGGAGLYYRAIERGIFEDSTSDFLLRKKLENSYMKNPKKLFNKLKKLDPEYSRIVHINNKKRLIRALEIYEITGLPPSSHFKSQKDNRRKNINLFTLLIRYEKEILADRIKKRLGIMLKNGWVEEVEDLLKKQKQKLETFPAINSIGYKHIIAYIKGRIEYEKMVEKIFIETRQYARKQTQWFKREPIDLYVDTYDVGQKKISQILCGLLKVII